MGVNEIDQFLFDNPEILEQFNKDHGDIIKALNERFVLLEADTIGRYLLSLALVETLRVATAASRQAIADQLLERGVCVMKGENTLQ